jgi:very-short-patch-repair endonuclease/RecA/RadA recombinase
MPNESQHFRIYLKGEDKTDIVRDFQRIGDKYSVTFADGKTFTYNASNVQIIESALNAPKSHERFEYLERIAMAVGLTTEAEEGKVINILSHNYSKIKFVPPNSMLGAFLSGTLPESKQNKPKVITDPVYPFGFNASQKDAVDKALANELSIIEGPPGTGKTQTILNIIANAVMRGENVAVVSGNNSATKNVLEKLQKHDIDFIAAYLGNTANKKDFINTQKPLPYMTDWILEPDTVSKLRQMLKRSYEALHEKLAQQNELSALMQELSAIKTERKYFLQYADSIDARVEPQVANKTDTSRKALEMWLLCETNGEVSQSKGLVAFIKNMFECLRLLFSERSRFARRLLGRHTLECLIAIFQRRFYELKIYELTQKVSTLKHELDAFDFNAKMREYADISTQLFRGNLAARYAARKREFYSIDDLWRNSESFIQDYPVILSTTYSLRSSLSSRVMYDYVIIDESSQVDLCTGALALSCARKAVVVGDLKQLPNVVGSKASAATDAIFAEFDLPEAYRYKNHSLLSAVMEMFPRAASTLLREHYRCHPKIIEFCNKKFYAGQLVILTEPKSEREPLLVYKTIAGRHERNRVNQRQIDVIKNEIIPRQKLDTTDGSLGIVTPYRNQTNALQKAFAEMRVKADTVDKFQGQENDVIILSTVDNEITEFTDNANRLNVAVSRAVEQLIVVVSDGDIQSDTNIGDLVRYIEYNNFTVVESKIYSVFDYLYKNYAERRCEFLAKHKRVSEYDSENLMYALITTTLKDERFSNFDVAVHVPLKMVIRDAVLLAPFEKQYAMNILTHVDFLIFNVIDKSPRLVVEVDGVAFHAENTRQSKHDAMKNTILEKYGLPVIRFRTDGSGERERLIAALRCV